MLEEEVRRDEHYRRSLTNQSQSATGLNRASAPTSIALPQRDFGESEDQKTPRAINGRMPMMTPGMGIGLATPGLSLLTQKPSNQSNMTPLLDAKSPTSASDYFAARPPSRPGTPGGMTSRAPTTPSETDERAPSAEADKAKETPGLFGKKKFRMSFAGKRLNKPAPEAAKPVIEEKPKEENESESKVEEELPYAGCFYGVVHQIRQEYAGKSVSYTHLTLPTKRIV